MRPRVLQFIGSFNQGGSERHAVDLCRSLRRDGTFDVYAATLNYDGILTADIEAIGLPEIPEFPLRSFFDINFVRQVRRCAAYLKENQIDLVHTHDFYTNVFGMAAARLAGVRARVASKRETGGMRSPMQDRVERAAFGIAQRVVVNSAAVGHYVEDRGIDAAKVVCIYNAVDLDRFSAVRPECPDIAGLNGLASDRSAKVISMVANLRHHVKNVPMLLEAASIVCRSRSDAHFVIAGEGPLEGELHERSEKLGVADKVHFIGRCTNVPELLSISNIGVLTSDAEGFSNSILEYMAAGKPVVATDVGGAREAIADGRTGYIIEPRDAKALADRLLWLLGDDDAAAEFGRSARRDAAEKFSTATLVERTKQLYSDLLA